MAATVTKPGSVRVASVQATSFPASAQVTAPVNFIVNSIGVQLESGSDYLEISLDGTNVSHRIPSGGLPVVLNTAARSIWLRSGAGTANAIVTVS